MQRRHVVHLPLDRSCPADVAGPAGAIWALAAIMSGVQLQGSLHISRLSISFLLHLFLTMFVDAVSSADTA